MYYLRGSSGKWLPNNHNRVSPNHLSIDKRDAFSSKNCAVIVFGIYVAGPMDFRYNSNSTMQIPLTVTMKKNNVKCKVRG